jgi:hypothetical protein
VLDYISDVAEIKNNPFWKKVKREDVVVSLGLMPKQET